MKYNFRFSSRLCLAIGLCGCEDNNIATVPTVCIFAISTASGLIRAHEGPEYSKNQDINTFTCTAHVNTVYICIVIDLCDNHDMAVAVFTTAIMITVLFYCDNTHNLIVINLYYG